MKNEKQQRAEYLLSELSGVEDRYLVAALQTKGQQKPRAFRRVLLIAACLSLSFVLAVSAFLLTSRVFDRFDKNSTNPGDGVPVTTEPATVWELDGVLNDADGASAIRIEEDELDFFSGECYVIWQYQGDSYYYKSRPLTEREQRTLRSSSAADSLQAPVTNADQPEVRIWIVEADGTVWTPYLQYTDGNFAAAELFDYHTEVVPSNDMISCISKLLK